MKESASAFLILAIIGIVVTNVVVIYKLNNISSTIEKPVNDISEILSKVKLLIP